MVSQTVEFGENPNGGTNFRRHYRLSARIYGFHPYERRAALRSGTNLMRCWPKIEALTCQVSLSGGGTRTTLHFIVAKLNNISNLLIRDR